MLIYLKIKLFSQDRPTESYKSPDGLVHRDVGTNNFNAIKVFRSPIQVAKICTKSQATRYSCLFTALFGARLLRVHSFSDKNISITFPITSINIYIFEIKPRQ